MRNVDAGVGRLFVREGLGVADIECGMPGFIVEPCVAHDWRGRPIEGWRVPVTVVEPRVRRGVLTSVVVLELEHEQLVTVRRVRVAGDDRYFTHLTHRDFALRLGAHQSPTETSEHWRDKLDEDNRAQVMRLRLEHFDWRERWRRQIDERNAAAVAAEELRRPRVVIVRRPYAS